MVEWGVLIVAAFLAGVLNTIAGGGTFLTFPALVFAGLCRRSPQMPQARSRYCPDICLARLGFQKN